MEKAVATFLPVILKKAAVETGYIREMSQEVLTILTLNCGYDASFTSTLSTMQSPCSLALRRTRR